MVRRSGWITGRQACDWDIATAGPRQRARAAAPSQQRARRAAILKLGVLQMG